MGRKKGDSSKYASGPAILTMVCGVMLLLVQLHQLGFRALATIISVLAGVAVVGAIVYFRVDSLKQKRSSGPNRAGLFGALLEAVENTKSASLTELIIVAASGLFCLFAISRLQIPWLENLILFVFLVFILSLIVVAQADSAKLSVLRRRFEQRGIECILEEVRGNMKEWSDESKVVVIASLVCVGLGLFSIF